jgi:hypothetical protein
MYRKSLMRLMSSVRDDVEFETCYAEYKKCISNIHVDAAATTTKKKMFDRYTWKDPNTESQLKEAPSHVPNKLNYKYEEYGVIVKGEEPTRYNEWERNGRTTDF